MHWMNSSTCTHSWACRCVCVCVCARARATVRVCVYNSAQVCVCMCFVCRVGGSMLPVCASVGMCKCAHLLSVMVTFCSAGWPLPLPFHKWPYYHMHTHTHIALYILHVYYITGIPYIVLNTYPILPHIHPCRRASPCPSLQAYPAAYPRVSTCQAARPVSPPPPRTADSHRAAATAGGRGETCFWAACQACPLSPIHSACHHCKTHQLQQGEQWGVWAVRKVQGVWVRSPPLQVGPSLGPPPLAVQGLTCSCCWATQAHLAA